MQYTLNTKAMLGLLYTISGLEVNQTYTYKHLKCTSFEKKTKKTCMDKPEDILVLMWQIQLQL